MKKRFRIIALLMAIPLTLSMLAACTPKEAPTTISQSDSATDTEQKQPDATTGSNTIGNTLKYDLDTEINGGKDITIEFWTQNELKEIHQQLINKYTAIHPNVKVNLTPMTSQDLFDQKLPIALQTGTGPDAFHMHNSREGVLLPYLAEFPADVLPIEDIKADFSQVDEHITDGKLYYIDMGLMTSGIFYNTDMWAEAGLTEADIPKTWDAFVEVAKKLTITDDSGKITREGVALNGVEPFLLMSRVLQDGNFLFDESQKALIDNEAWATQLEFVQSFFTEHKVSSTQHPKNTDAFANGQSAMTYNWGWFGSWLVQDSYADLNWSFFMLPTMDGNAPPAFDRNNGEATFSVSNKSTPEAQAVVFDMLKYFLCDDDLLAQADVVLNIAPTKVTLKDHPDIIANIVLRLQGENLDRTIWPGALPEPYYAGILTYAVEPVILNNASIADSLKQAEEVINKDLSAFTFNVVERDYVFASEFK